MRHIEISEETYEKLKDQLLKDSSFKELTDMKDFIGQKWFFRTVTYHVVGRVKRIVGGFFYMEDAAWVADSGRFMQAIKDGKLNEVEPVGDWIVAIGSIVDGGPWKHALPKEQK
jgi:hypothetical protein